MCTVLLPPGDNPIAVNKYIISYHIIIFVALVIRHAVRMRHLSSGSCQAQHNSYSLCLTRHDFRKKCIEYKYVFRFLLQSLSQTFLILPELSEILKKYLLVFM